MNNHEKKYLNFNKDLGYTFEKSLFSILENNAKYGPEYNTFPTNEWIKIQANFVKSKGKLFRAIKNLYKNELINHSNKN